MNWSYQLRLGFLNFDPSHNAIFLMLRKNRLVRTCTSWSNCWIYCLLGSCKQSCLLEVFAFISVHSCDPFDAFYRGKRGMHERWKAGKIFATARVTTLGSIAIETHRAAGSHVWFQGWIWHLPIFAVFSRKFSNFAKISVLDQSWNKTDSKY